MKFFIMENFKLLEVRQTFVAVVLVFNYFFLDFRGVTYKEERKEKKKKKGRRGRAYLTEPTKRFLTHTGTRTPPRSTWIVHAE